MLNLLMFIIHNIEETNKMKMKINKILAHLFEILAEYIKMKNAEYVVKEKVKTFVIGTFS